MIPSKFIVCLAALTCCVSCGVFKGKSAGGGGAPSAPATATAKAGPSQQRIFQLTGEKDVVIIDVPASGWAGSEAMAKGVNFAFGQGSLPKSVGKSLKGAHDQGHAAYVGGPSPAKVEWALREALIHSSPTSLSGLVVYTNATLTPELQQAGRQARTSVLKLNQ